MRLSEPRASMPGRPPATEIHPDLKDDEICYKNSIRVLRDQMHLNQAQFARQFGLNTLNARYTIGRWERLSCIDLPGKVNMQRMRELFKLNANCRSTGDKVDYLK